MSAARRLRRLELCGLGRPDWLAAAEASWAAPAPSTRRKVAVPIWRDPWMAVGGQTYTDDLLTRAGDRAQGSVADLEQSDDEMVRAFMHSTHSG